MMKQFKILYLSHCGKFVGGGQKGLFYILERVNRKYFEPMVIAPDEGLFLDKVSKLSIPTKCLKMGKLTPLSLITTVSKVIRLIKRERIDLIYTDSPREGIYAGIAAKIMGKPLVYHARVSDRSRLDKWIYFLSTKIIAVSKASARRFSKGNGGQSAFSKKVKIIYNAIDLTEFNPRINGNRIRKEFNVSDILIGTVGQLIPEKGQKDLLLVVPDILKSYPAVKFVIVGNGNSAYRKELEELSRSLSIAANVIFTGFREDLPAIMAAIDIFVLFTSNEGLCRTIIEAMASEKPVITTSVGGNPETVTDGLNGILVPPDNPRRLAEVIGELIKDKDKRVKMGVAARKRTEELFDIAENIRRIEHVYEELL